MSGTGKRELAFRSLPTQIRDKRGRLYQVRAYEAGDFEDLKEMYDSFEPKGMECGLPPPDDQVRLKWLGYVTSELFNVLATHKNKVVGHCALDLSCSPRCPEYLIFIRKGFRDRGIGTALSEVMKELADEAGCEKVVLTVRTANRRAIKVFERGGFVFCGGIEAERDMELPLKPRKTDLPTGCRK
ncbi:MAG: GNAT family N-acetyltransferase [Deltaproteobacteria bacterium]|nr:GNAT family N-acetyltransferase [Deltaproteobacteria bacterium]